MSYKKKIMRTFLVLEVVFFFGNYLVSKNGLHAIMSLKQENEKIAHSIQETQNAIKTLEDELVLWDVYSFYKEKVAREQLHMARKNETIYYCS